MDEEKKSEEQQGSSWYKKWFILIQPDSPLATYSGVYDLGTVTAGGPETVPVPESLNQGAMEIGRRLGQKGYVRYLIKRSYQEDLFIASKSSGKQIVLDAQQIRRFARDLREFMDFQEYPDLALDFTMPYEEKPLHRIIGITPNPDRPPLWFYRIKGILDESVFRWSLTKGNMKKEAVAVYRA